MQGGAGDAATEQQQGCGDSRGCGRQHAQTIRWFATLGAFVMVLTAFTGLARPVAAQTGTVTPLGGASLGVTQYGRGIALTPTTQGEQVAFVPTFQRWDFAYLPTAALNLTTGNWPYLVAQNATQFSITRQGSSFMQAKIPGAVYQFQPNRIEETIVLPNASAMPNRGSLGVGLRGSYIPIVNGTTVSLLDAAGNVVWQTADYTARDSSAVPQTYANPVTSVTLAPFGLTLRLDPNMLTWATYPLYIDPTWVLKANANNVWGGTLDYVTSDWGDQNLRLGYLADDFNDNKNEIWTVTSGKSFSVTGGQAKLTATEIHASGSWSDAILGTTVNFASCGAGNVFFRYSSSSNYYYLNVNFAGKTVTLNKVINGVTTALSPTLAETMAANTNYDVKVLARGNYFEIWWAGTRVWSGTDRSPPGSPLSGNIGLSETTSKCTLYTDNVRLRDTLRWLGNYTSSVRDAYTSQSGDVVTQARLLGAADSYSVADLWINSSSDNHTWGGWHLVKAMAAPGTYYAVPDVDQKRYYQLRAVLRTGVDGTPSVAEIDANEAAPPIGVVATTNTGLLPWTLYVGGDVNAVSGNLVLTWTDLSAQAKGFTLGVTRTYNSAVAGTIGPLGLGTMDAYHAHLSFPAGGNVTYTAGDGSLWTFVTLGGNAYSPPRGLHDNLIKNADGTYALWAPDGSRTNFNTAGQLTTLVDRNGNHLMFTYTNGNPTKVADDSGYSLILSYDASNRVSSVVDSGNRKVLYTYDISNRLTTFTDPMGFTENYTYDASNRLVQRVDRAGHVDRFVYDASGRVTQVWAGEWSYPTNTIRWQVEAYAISYLSGTQTQATNALGGVTTLTFNSLGNPISIVGPSVGCALCSRGNATSYTWDGEFNSLTVADGRGDATSSAYDWMGNALSVRDPSGNLSLRTFSNVQNATQFLSLQTSSGNPRGYTTRYTYYPSGNLYATIHPDGNTSYQFYDAAGSLNRSKDFRGNSLTYGYDVHEFRISSADAGGNTTTYQNDAIGRTWNTTTPGGNATRKVYDLDGRVTSVTDPLGNPTTFGYDKDGRITSTTDPNGLVTTSTYNLTLGLVQQQVSPGGNVTTCVLDYLSDRLQTLVANRIQMTFTYNAFRRMLNQTTPGGNVTRYLYDGAGNPISKTEANGTVLQYTYDRLNRLVRTTYPGGSTESTVYDANGNAVEKKALELDDFYVYDMLDRVIQTRQVFLDTALTVWHNYTYDANGNRRSMDGPGGGTYTWDANNRIQTETDAVGNQWTYAYGRDGQLLKEVFPDGGYASYGYDRDGHLTAQNDYPASGGVLQSLAYGYDPGGRRASAAAFTSASQGQFTDLPNNTAAVTSNLAVSGLSASPQSVTVSVYASVTLSAPTYNPPCPYTTVTWHYVLNGVLHQIAAVNEYTGGRLVCQRLVSATYTATVSVMNGDLLQGEITFENDAIVTTAVNALSVSYRSGLATTTYAYDRESRLIQVTNPDGTNVQYTYDAVGNRLTYVSGATTTYTYNADNELTSSTDGTSYGYDANGNQISRTTSSGTSYYDYGYDHQPAIVAKSQPLSAHWNKNCAPEPAACTFPVTIPTVAPSPQTVTVTVSASGELDLAQLFSCPAVTVYWYYTLNGNTVQIGSQVVQLTGNRYNPCSATFSGTYSASVAVHSSDVLYGRISHSNSNVLFNLTSSNAIVVSTTVAVPFESFGYGPGGLLSGALSAGASTTTHLGYDLMGLGGLPARVVEYAGSMITKSYFHGVGADRPLGLTVGGISYYYHRDGLGSVTLVTDASANVAASNHYDAYGNLLSGSADSVGNPLRFDAMASDLTSGLVYDRARFYNPSTGRFLTPDQGCMKSGATRYVYVNDNPVNRRDPTGHDCDPVTNFALNAGCDVPVAFGCAAIPLPGLDVGCGLVGGWLCTIGVDAYCGGNVFFDLSCSTLVGQTCSSSIKAHLPGASVWGQGTIDWLCDRLADLVCGAILSLVGPPLGPTSDPVIFRGGGGRAFVPL